MLADEAAKIHCVILHQLRHPTHSMGSAHHRSYLTPSTFNNRQRPWPCNNNPASPLHSPRAHLIPPSRRHRVTAQTDMRLVHAWPHLCCHPLRNELTARTADHTSSMPSLLMPTRNHIPHAHASHTQTSAFLKCHAWLATGGGSVLESVPPDCSFFAMYIPSPPERSSRPTDQPVDSSQCFNSGEHILFYTSHLVSVI